MLFPNLTLIFFWCFYDAKRRKKSSWFLGLDKILSRFLFFAVLKTPQNVILDVLEWLTFDAPTRSAVEARPGGLL
jgi:hypothetical protein